MKKLFVFLILFCSLNATPNSVFWTVCTTDVYDTGIGHIDVDNYFTVFNKRGRGSAFLPDVGLEVGLFSFKDWKTEGGFDYIGGADDPLYFNYGMGIAEGKLFENSPSFKVGIFNVGTRHRYYRTDQNIVDIIVGKDLPKCIGGGRLFFAGFSGSRAMGKNRQGFMAAYTQAFCPETYCDETEFNRWVFVADYASGKNTIGGGGCGIYYYFNPYISILNGPVWFNLHEKWKWTVQIDISFKMY